MKISEEIINVLEYLCGKIGVTIDWTSENVIPYTETLFQKFIKWEIATSTCWIILTMVVTLIIMIHTSKINKKYDDDEMSVILNIFGAISLSIVVLVIGVQIFDIIQCCTFTEKNIYEFITSYIDRN